MGIPFCVCGLPGPQEPVAELSKPIFACKILLCCPITAALLETHFICSGIEEWISTFANAACILQQAHKRAAVHSPTSAKHAPMLGEIINERVFSWPRAAA